MSLPPIPAGRLKPVFFSLKSWWNFMGAGYGLKVDPRERGPAFASWFPGNRMPMILDAFQSEVGYL
jgi:hypothetical protein